MRRRTAGWDRFAVGTMAFSALVFTLDAGRHVITGEPLRSVNALFLAAMCVHFGLRYVLEPAGKGHPVNILGYIASIGLVVMFVLRFL